MLGLLVDGPRHAVVGAQGVAVFLLGPHVEQQRAGLLLLVEVDGDVELPGLQLQGAGVIELQDLLNLALRQNGRREREPRNVAARMLLPQPPQQRRGADNIANGAELDEQNALRNRLIHWAVATHIAMLLVGAAG